MHRLSIALKKQKREIEKLKRIRIRAYRGFGKEQILYFSDYGFQYADETTDIQRKIDEGHYKSIEDFDSYYTSDIEFSHLYRGRKIGRYQYRTKQNLTELGKSWRERVAREFPGAEVTIVVHNHDGIWFLDTFNYPIDVEDGVYL